MAFSMKKVIFRLLNGKYYLFVLKGNNAAFIIAIARSSWPRDYFIAIFLKPR